MPCPTDVSLDPSNMIPPLPLHGIRFHNESVQGTKTAANRKLTLQKKKKIKVMNSHPPLFTLKWRYKHFSSLKSLYIFSFNDLKILVAEFQLKFHSMGKKYFQFLHLNFPYFVSEISCSPQAAQQVSSLSLKSCSIFTWRACVASTLQTR